MSIREEVRELKYFLTLNEIRSRRSFEGPTSAQPPGPAVQYLRSTEPVRIATLKNIESLDFLLILSISVALQPKNKTCVVVICGRYSKHPSINGVLFRIVSTIRRSGSDS